MISRYDAVIVLCGGLRRDGDGYHPASFTDSDGFGMLGSHIRVVAAADLYRAGYADVFVFATGVSRRLRARFGPQVPAEAAVYAEHFRDLAGDGPAILVETDSVNTAGNVAAIAGLAGRRGWRQVAIVTNEYHAPRVRELLRRAGAPVTAEILSAEALVMAAWRGEYDAEINAGYASPAGLWRMVCERRGLADLYGDRYDMSEQLAVTAAEPGSSPLGVAGHPAGLRPVHRAPGASTSAGAATRGRAWSRRGPRLVPPGARG
jgi:uncharacterized SAM-binding protein YcdF (DUF218 family)